MDEHVSTKEREITKGYIQSSVFYKSVLQEYCSLGNSRIINTCILYCILDDFQILRHNLFQTIEFFFSSNDAIMLN